jgi:hypothetical protein
MHRGGQAPSPANDIKHGKMAVVGLAGGFFGPYQTRPSSLLGRSPQTDTIDKGQQNDVRPSQNNQGITMKLSFAKKKNRVNISA